MSKLKPCMNDMCIAFSTSYSGNCSWYPDDWHCNELYTTTKPVHKKMWEKIDGCSKEMMKLGKSQNNQALIFTAGVMQHNIRKIEKELKE